MNAFPPNRAAEAERDDGGLHRRLAGFNARRLEPAGPPAPAQGDAEHGLLIAMQNDFVERERERVQPAATAAPRQAGPFVAWFTALQEQGEGQGDSLFPWLAQCAGLEDMRWFLAQEAAGEAGFDDLVALTQLKLPARAKLEMARNFWDEMGRGDPAHMHGRLLDRLIRHLGIRVERERTAWPALALGNLMVALATQRHYAYQSIGALGVIELTAPGRAEQVACGLRRLGVGAPERSYFEIHATLDRKHAQAWNEEVIAPLVEQDAEVARWIAEGALMRLAAGARCFASYRAALLPEGALAAGPR